MDNDGDTIFTSPKSLLGLFFIGAVLLYVMHWIYKNIIKDNQTKPNQNNIHRNGRNNIIIKQKMSINLSILMKDSKKINFRRY